MEMAVAASANSSVHLWGAGAVSFLPIKPLEHERPVPSTLKSAIRRPTAIDITQDAPPSSRHRKTPQWAPIVGFYGGLLPNGPNGPKRFHKTGPKLRSRLQDRTGFPWVVCNCGKLDCPSCELWLGAGRNHHPAAADESGTNLPMITRSGQHRRSRSPHRRCQEASPDPTRRRLCA
jgi:hypothetical protein